MKAKNLCVYAGLCAGVASVATGQTQKSLDLQNATAGQKVDPIQFAKVAMNDGKITFQSDWMAYNGATSRATNVQIFDCFGDGYDGPADRAPDGGDDPGCGGPFGLGPTSRWYFGSGYCNMFFTNDMTVDPATVIGDGSAAMDLAWFWTVNGSFTSEVCIIAIFTQESDPNNCDPDSFDYSGWAFSFGTLPSGVGGGYYYSNLDLGTAGVWPLPSTGTGSYAIFYLQGITTSGQFIAATCAQPMLWGSPDAHGSYAGGSTQGPGQFDDDFIMDLSHTSSECYTYSYSSICPTVLGGMAQFWGNTDDGGDPCLDGPFPNCNGDTVVNTQDFTCFLNKWVAAFQSGTYDADADCNGDSVVNTQDFTCFFNAWNPCRG